MRSQSRRPGFTLTELLAVVAIIVLLISILIPSVSAIRNQARNTSSTALVKAISDGCEIFKGDQKDYPKSGSANPFINYSSAVSGKHYAQGAQWAAMQLVGPDLTGWVSPDKKSNNAANTSPEIDHKDWEAWYGLNDSDKYARGGPYVPPQANVIATPKKYVETFTQADKTNFLVEDKVGDPWSLSQLPFFYDGHGSPILYYRAKPYAKQAIATGAGPDNDIEGIYDQSHNGYLTGYDGENGQYAVTNYESGWDFAGLGDEYPHPIRELGFQPNQKAWPGDAKPESFAAYFLDKAIFDTTAKGGSGGRFVPYNAETFILISAGRDGRYGTKDDIRNFTGRGS